MLQLHAHYNSCFSGSCKDLVQGVLENLDVVINECLFLLELGLLRHPDKRQVSASTSVSFGY